MKAYKQLLNIEDINFDSISKEDTFVVEDDKFMWHVNGIDFKTYCKVQNCKICMNYNKSQHDDPCRTCLKGVNQFEQAIISKK